MNTVVDNSLVDSRRTVWQWLFAQPPIGSAPARINPQLMARLVVDPIRPVVMARACLYFDAGCPLDLCETAASRDLWLALNQIDHHGEANEQSSLA